MPTAIIRNDPTGRPTVIVIGIDNTQILAFTHRIAFGFDTRYRLLRTVARYGWVATEPITSAVDAQAIPVQPTHVCPRCQGYLDVQLDPLLLACTNTYSCAWEGRDWTDAQPYGEPIARTGRPPLRHRLALRVATWAMLHHPAWRGQRVVHAQSCTHAPNGDASITLRLRWTENGETHDATASGALPILIDFLVALTTSRMERGASGSDNRAEARHETR